MTFLAYKMNNLSSERRVCIIVAFTISFSWEKDYTQSEQSWREGPGSFQNYIFYRFLNVNYIYLLHCDNVIWCDVTFGFIFIVFTSSSFDIIDLCKKFSANPHQLNGLQSLKAAEIFSLILVPIVRQVSVYVCVCVWFKLQWLEDYLK